VPLLCSALLTLLFAAAPEPASAFVRIAGYPWAPPCPPIPDAVDIQLTIEELAAIEDGEILLRIIDAPGGGRVAEAIGYLDATPLLLFDLATDSSLAIEMVDEVRSVDVLERKEGGKVFRSVFDPGAFLPEFEYTVAAAYPDPPTGQCWSLIDGDFERNEGSHSFLWDPERRQTLAVFTFVFKLKGILALLPEQLILRRAGGALERYMERLEVAALRERERATDRARRVASAWAELEPRMYTDALSARLWRGQGLWRAAFATQP
jgi:hypothetical protein